MQYKVLLFLILFTIFSCQQKQEPTEDAIFAEVLRADGNEQYTKAIEPREFTFPQDHLPHNDFKIEWWYVTGNLKTAEGREFGYQFTIFRNALTAEKKSNNMDNSEKSKISDWQTNQMYFAHIGLTDIQSNKLYHYERFSREKQGLAGADSNSISIYVEDLKLQIIEGEQDEIRISAHTDDFSLNLSMLQQKPKVFHGINGLSAKGFTEGNASYYYSYTRLATKGNILINNQEFNVTGNSWMDREWSSSILEENQEGWDWFSLQFFDNTEIMYFRLRDKNDIANSFEKGTFISADEISKFIEKEEVRLLPLEFWKSDDNINYPIRWELNYLTTGKKYLISAVIPNQVMNLSVKYWEGAVRIYDINSPDKLIGVGYMELTGYN